MTRKSLQFRLAIALTLCLPLAAGAGTTTVVDVDFESAAYTVGNPMPAADNVHSPALSWAQIGTGSGTATWNVVASTIAGGAMGFETAPAVTPTGVLLGIKENSAVNAQNGGTGIPIGWAEYWWKDVTPTANAASWYLTVFNSATTSIAGTTEYGIVNGVKAAGQSLGTMAFGGTVAMVSGGPFPGYTRDVEYFMQMTWEASANPPIFRIRKMVSNPSTTPVQMLAAPIVGNADSVATDTSVRSVGVLEDIGPTQVGRIQIGKIRVGAGTAPLAPGEAAPPNRAGKWDSYE